MRACGKVGADALKPLHARHFAARRLDAANGFLRRLDRHHHVMRIGMQHVSPSRRDRHVAFPEHQIAALELGRRRRFPKRSSCMSLSRGRSTPAGLKYIGTRPDNQCRARSCRPPIRTRRKSSRDHDEIGCFGLPASRLNRGKCQPWAVTAKRSSWRAIATAAPIGSAGPAAI